MLDLEPIVHLQLFVCYCSFAIVHMLGDRERSHWLKFVFTSMEYDVDAYGDRISNLIENTNVFFLLHPSVSAHILR